MSLRHPAPATFLGMLGTHQPPTPTLTRRYIGWCLYALRMRKRLAIDVVARRAGRTEMTIRQIEDGARRTTVADVLALCDVYQPSSTDVEALADLARKSEQGHDWWDDCAKPALARYFTLFLGLEDSALLIRQFSDAVVPGLLQTREYTTALLHELTATPTRRSAGKGGVELLRRDVPRRVEVRQRRQRVLTRDNNPLHLNVVIAQSVLRRQVGTAGTMERQMRHLLAMADRRNVSVRILPTRTPVRPESAYMLLTLPVPEPLALSRERDRGGTTVASNSWDVGQYIVTQAQIEGSALDPEASLREIRKAAEQWEKASTS
ncbi:helix-turn-helix domain-containing protein [Plantactinospora sp. CA-290183]|uniref:helix-turn-helix domain-containing protein n=1 Tax=Plantactinospora sp. CA-290183 TaxID=3240006 RepID=UPI003D949AD4